MQFKVPQNIDMADRIVGPLTLVQFLYLLVGGIVVYFLFSTIAPVNPLLFTVTAMPIAFMSFALAFLKVQDQPFGKFVVAAVHFISKPKARMWHKDGPDPELTITPDTHKESGKVEHKSIKKSQLDQLIQVLDTGGAARANQPDLPEKAEPAIHTFKPMSLIKKSRPVLDNVRKK